MERGWRGMGRQEVVDRWRGGGVGWGGMRQWTGGEGVGWDGEAVDRWRGGGVGWGGMRQWTGGEGVGWDGEAGGSGQVERGWGGMGRQEVVDRWRGGGAGWGGRR